MFKEYVCTEWSQGEKFEDSLDRRLLSCVQGTPEGGCGRGTERMEQWTAALWRKTDKQGRLISKERERKQKKRRKGKETGNRKEKGEEKARERKSGEDLWDRIACGSYKKTSDANSDSPG